MKNFTQQTDTPDPKLPSKLTDEVVSRYKDCPDPRLKEIMISLVKHLHSFARCRRNQGVDQLWMQILKLIVLRLLGRA